MTFGFVNKIAMVAFCMLIVFTSCQKEDSVSIIETEEILEVGFKMTVNGTEVEMDAVAAYCQTDDTEFLIIANKQENLSLPLQTQNFEANDFVFFTSNSGDSSWSYGGQALGEDITGQPYLSIVFSEAKLLIAENNGEVVAGTSSGILYGFDPTGNLEEQELVEYTYEITFVAEIVQESDFCTNSGGYFKMTVNDEEVVTDAVASYCQNGDSEFLMIANKDENLSLPLQTQNFEANDFVFFTGSSEEGSYSYGGQALGEDITGQPYLSIVFSEANLDIEYNDGTTVAGSSTGVLYGFDPTNSEPTEFTYEIKFIAPIVQVSDACE